MAGSDEHSANVTNFVSFLFVGLGEMPDDVEPVDPAIFVQALFDNTT